MRTFRSRDPYFAKFFTFVAASLIIPGFFALIFCAKNWYPSGVMTAFSAIILGAFCMGLAGPVRVARDKPGFLSPILFTLGTLVILTPRLLETEEVSERNVMVAMGLGVGVLYYLAGWILLLGDVVGDRLEKMPFFQKRNSLCE